MSAFHDYIVDFPKRGLDILKHFEPHAKRMDREVTLMLMVASSSFLVPRERLEIPHPSQDSTRFAKFRKELNKRWDESPLFKNLSEWLHGTVKNFGNGPDAWPTPTEKVCEKNVEHILGIIRNALAHGNLFTEGSPIHTLTFYSAKRKMLKNCQYEVIGYRFLKIPVDDFKQFLLNWFDLLNTIDDINYREVLEVLPQTHE